MNRPTLNDLANALDDLGAAADPSPRFIEAARFDAGLHHAVQCHRAGRASWAAVLEELALAQAATLDKMKTALLDKLRTEGPQAVFLNPKP